MVIESTLWVSKYRPKSLNDVVIDDNSMHKLNNYIETSNLNNCLFCGNPGTGKTSIALIMRDSLIKSEYDSLFLNASNDRGINVMRDTVLEFMKTPPVNSPIKLVIMDEADSLTPDAWKILRNPIENPDINADLKTRFIFTANYVSAIPDFIKSRCDCYIFTSMPVEFMINRCKEILTSEKVEYDDADVDQTVSDMYPDMRATINALQCNTINGKLTYHYNPTSIIEVKNLFKSCLIKINEGAFDEAISLIYEIRKATASYVLDYALITKCVLDEEEIPFECFSIMNHYLNTFSRSVDGRIHFLAMISDIIFTLRRVRNG